MDPLNPLAPPSEGPEAIHKVPATPPVIAPGHTFGTVTDKISSIVLTRKTPLGWWLGFGLASMFTFRTAARYVVRGRVLSSPSSA